MWQIGCFLLLYVLSFARVALNFQFDVRFFRIATISIPEESKMQAKNARRLWKIVKISWPQIKCNRTTNVVALPNISRCRFHCDFGWIKKSVWSSTTKTYVHTNAICVWRARHLTVFTKNVLRSLQKKKRVTKSKRIKGETFRRVQKVLQRFFSLFRWFHLKLFRVFHQISFSQIIFPFQTLHVFSLSVSLLSFLLALVVLLIHLSFSAVPLIHCVFLSFDC